jgi:hypothetical protein
MKRETIVDRLTWDVIREQARKQGCVLNLFRRPRCSRRYNAMCRDERGGTMWAHTPDQMAFLLDRNRKFWDSVTKTWKE